MICKKCLKDKRICARGLCSRCYELERIDGNLNKYTDYRYKGGLTKTTCGQCGKEFESYPTTSGPRKYCSRQCYEISERATSEQDNSRIIEMYSNGLSASKIAIEFNVSNSTITNILDLNGLLVRPGWSYSRKYPINEYVFDDLDSELSAYWLGFIYADGYVSRDEFRVTLKASDVSHLEKLSQFMQSNQVPKPDTTGGRYITFHGLHLTEVLVNLGVVIKRGQFHRVLVGLPCEQYHHFIRGYLDGDGYISKIDTKYTGNVGFLGQEDILNWIKQVLTIHCNKIGNPKITQRKGIKELAFGGRRQLSYILRWIYKDATVYLPRKYERAMYWINL